MLSSNSVNDVCLLPGIGPKKTVEWKERDLSPVKDVARKRKNVTRLGNPARQSVCTFIEFYRLFFHFLRIFSRDISRLV